MKKLLTILAVALMCTTVACEQKSDEVIEPAKFDPDLDGPPSRLDKPVNEDIAKDQRRIAREAGRAAAAVASPPASPSLPAPAVGGPADEVKQVVARMIAVAAAGQEDRLDEFYASEGAKAFGPIFKAARQLQTKSENVDKLAQDRLGVKLPGSEESFFQMLSGLPGLPGDLSRATLAEFQFERDGQDVLVKGPKGQSLRFSEVGEAWKIKVRPEIRQMDSALRELIGAFDTATDEMVAGLRDGSITKENLQSKSQELTGKHILPAIGKYEQARSKVMQPPGAPPPDTSL